MVRVLAASLSVCLLAGNTPEETLAAYKLDAEVLREGFFEAVGEGDFERFPALPQFEAVPASARVAVVQAFFAFARAYTRSSEFTARYAAWRLTVIPARPRPPQTRAQLIKEVKAEVAERRKDLEEGLGGLPKDQTDKMREQFDGWAKPSIAMAEAPDSAEQDRQRYAEQMEGWEQANASRSADPRVPVRGLLRVFLADTTDVDFKAKLDGRGHFRREKFEEKVRLWKAGYFAGPEALRAARDEASRWLAELDRALGGGLDAGR